MNITVSIRHALSQEMAMCAAILNDWIDETDWMPRMHSHADVLKYYQTEVAANRKTLVAVDGERVRGFASLTPDGFVTALYVERQSRNQGIGNFLLERIKRELSPHVSLYTFEANSRARAFYERQGFVEVNRTTGDNDEGLPDILLEWHE